MQNEFLDLYELSEVLNKTEDAVKMKSYRIIQKLKNLVINCLEG